MEKSTAVDIRKEVWVEIPRKEAARINDPLLQRVLNSNLKLKKIEVKIPND